MYIYISFNIDISAVHGATSASKKGPGSAKGASAKGASAKGAKGQAEPASKE